MTAVDLKKYIFENNKVSLILEDIGCHNIKYHCGSSEYYSCANYDGDNPNAVTIYNTKYLNYINYTRGITGDMKQDIINLVEYNKNLSFGEAVKYLHNFLGIPFVYTKKVTKVEKVDPLNIFKKYKIKRYQLDTSDIKYLNEDVMSELAPVVHIDIFKEGVTEASINKFGLCYDFRHRRTVFPIHYWLDGRLIGCNERTSIKNYDELGITKYWLTPGMNKSINLYGLWENKSEIERFGYVTVVESEKSVVKRDSRFDPTCVALSGHYMSSEQVRILLGLHINEIIIAMDNDVSIWEILNMCEKFWGLRKVSFIRDTNGILGEKDSPVDAHNSDYEKLFKNRIVYDEKLHKKYLKYMRKNAVNNKN